MIEALIGYHCGPALAGIKPANLVTCRKKEIPEIQQEIKRLNLELNRRDIYLETLRECDNCVLVMVYRSNVLEYTLTKPEIKTFLQEQGYPTNSCKEAINYLKQRLQKEEFPHEIGAFLGYPMEDIKSFIHHREEGCLLTGEWKVYHNEEIAKAIFCRYSKCRKAIIKHIMAGKTLAQLFCAA